MDRAIDKACRGSEVPLRAFWSKLRSQFYMNWVKSKNQIHQVLKKPQDFFGLI